MFKGFNLTLTNVEIDRLTDNNGTYTFQDKKAEIAEIRGIMKGNALRTIDNFINDEGIIDATSLMKEWFPTVKADVFISHSHQDEELAIQLATWLKNTFNLNSFIDSTVWGYAGELLKNIDEKYCYDTISKVYNYNTRNFSTSHVHIMLSSALNTMIDQTECLIFLNTTNSLNIGDSISQKTFSPWIFNEIMTSSIVRKHYPRKELVHKTTDFQNKEERNLPNFAYDLDLNHLKNINLEELESWQTAYKADVLIANMTQNKNHPLDLLYFNYAELRGLYGK